MTKKCPKNGHFWVKKGPKWAVFPSFWTCLDTKMASRVERRYSNILIMQKKVCFDVSDMSLAGFRRGMASFCVLRW